MSSVEGRRKTTRNGKDHDFRPIVSTSGSDSFGASFDRSAYVVVRTDSQRRHRQSGPNHHKPNRRQCGSGIAVGEGQPELKGDGSTRVESTRFNRLSTFNTLSGDHDTFVDFMDGSEFLSSHNVFRHSFGRHQSADSIEVSQIKNLFHQSHTSLNANEEHRVTGNSRKVHAAAGGGPCMSPKATKEDKAENVMEPTTPSSSPPHSEEKKSQTPHTAPPQESFVPPPSTRESGVQLACALEQEGRDTDRDPRMTPGSSVYSYEYEEGIEAAIPTDIPDSTEYRATVPSQPQPASSACGACWRRIKCGVVVLGLATIIAVILLWAFGGLETLGSYFGKDQPPNINGTELWDVTGHQGLTLELLNALEDKWTPYFDDRVAAWDNGMPDALTLTTSKVSYDFDCSPVDGKVKVCNGNYGATDWTGITMTFIVDDFIQNAVSTMNDYFLDNEKDALKYYTMCHEVGHAFGLAHTDENFYNKDQGNCMDYTSWPRNNMNPGQFLFDHLAEMYGVVNSNASTGPSTSTGSNNGTIHAHHNHVTRRGARRLMDGKAPHHVQEQYKLAAAALKTMSCLAWAQLSPMEHNAWMLHKRDHGEECSINLGEGYSMRIHKLLAVEK